MSSTWNATEVPVPASPLRTLLVRWRVLLYALCLLAVLAIMASSRGHDTARGNTAAATQDDRPLNLPDR